MKKVYTLIIFLLCINTMIDAQPQLSFRVTNPRDTTISGNQYWLAYDIEVKASVSGYFMNSLQANFYYNSGIFSTTPSIVGLKSGLSNYNVGGAYGITTSYGSSKLNFYINKTTTGTPWLNWSEPLSNYFVELPTSYTKLVIALVRIGNENPADPNAGIFFARATMSNQQFYQDPLSAGGFLCSMNDPQSYDTTKYLRNFYLGRIYSAQSGWTMSGRNPATSIDWTQDRNMSVWDTAGSTAHLTQAGSKARRLRIHNAARLTLDPGSDLTCSGATEINEARGLIVGTQVGMAQFLDNGTITYNNGGSASVWTTFSQDKWHYYTIPVTTTNATPFFLKYMKYYEEPTSHWKFVWANNFAPDTTLNTPMQGYAMWAYSTGSYITPGYFYVTGTLNTAPKTSIPITTSGTPGSSNSYGWNFIGNPFTSAVNLGEATMNWGTCESKAYFWDPISGNYKAYNNGTYTIHSQYAPAQQGFFVWKPEGASSNITIPQAARVINSEPFLKSTYNTPDLLHITTTFDPPTEYNDEALVAFNQDATDGYDATFDIVKMWGEANAPQIFTTDNTDAYLTSNVQNWVSDTKIVPMGFFTYSSGNYRITASNIESFGTKHVYLVDKQTNNWQELNLNPQYDFSYTYGDPMGRFEIHFMQFALGTGDKALHNMKIYSNEHNLYIMNVTNEVQRGTVEVVDMTGRVVFTSALQGNKVSIFTPGVSAAYYAVRVTTENGVYSGKVFLQ